MKKPPPKNTEIEEWARDFKARFKAPDAVNEWPAPPEMWQKILDLIYSGNMEAGWRLLELSWPGKGKEKFLREFKK
jgi:hypothetical protein